MYVLVVIDSTSLGKESKLDGARQARMEFREFDPDAPGKIPLEVRLLEGSKQYCTVRPFCSIPLRVGQTATLIGRTY